MCVNSTVHSKMRQQCHQQAKIIQSCIFFRSYSHLNERALVLSIKVNLTRAHSHTQGIISDKTKNVKSYLASLI